MRLALILKVVQYKQIIFYVKYYLLLKLNSFKNINISINYINCNISYLKIPQINDKNNIDIIDTDKISNNNFQRQMDFPK